MSERQTEKKKKTNFFFGSVNWKQKIKAITNEKKEKLERMKMKCGKGELTPTINQDSVNKINQEKRKPLSYLIIVAALYS